MLVESVDTKIAKVDELTIQVRWTYESLVKIWVGLATVVERVTVFVSPVAPNVKSGGFQARRKVVQLNIIPTQIRHFLINSPLRHRWQRYFRNWSSPI